MTRRRRIEIETAAELILLVALGCDAAGRDVVMRDAIISRDGTVLLLGQTALLDIAPPDAGVDAAAPPPGDVWVARTNETREAVWQNAYGTGGLETAEAMVELPSERIVAVGAATGPTDEDAWVLALEPGGSLGFEVLLSGPGAQHLYDAAVLATGRFAVAGTAVDSTGAPGVLVASFDPDGVTDWQTLLVFPAASRLVAPRVLARADGGLVILASCDFAVVDGPLLIWTAVLTPTGAVEAQLVMASPNEDELVDALLVDGDRAIVVVGSVARPTRDPDPPDEVIIPNTDVWIAKATLAGAVEWRVELRNEAAEVPSRIVARRTGGFAVLATADGFGTRMPFDTDLWWIEIDADGRVVDQRAVLNRDPERPIAAFEVGTGDLFVVGSVTDRGGRLGPVFWTLFADRTGGGIDGCGRLEETAAVVSTSTAMITRELVAIQATSMLELVALGPLSARPPPLSQALCDPGT